MSRLRRLFPGGSAGNEQLTAVVATVLLVLLAVEGATVLRIGSLLSVHAFVGLLLVPVVILKLAGTGWRMVRYYLRGEEYVRRGPPHLFLRAVVAPVAVASTLVLFGSGVALLVLAQTSGTIVGLHKASFVVWLGAMSVHVLTRISRLPEAMRVGVPGLALRAAVIGSSLVAGLALAMATLPAADQLQDSVSGHVAVDPRWLDDVVTEREQRLWRRVELQVEDDLLVRPFAHGLEHVHGRLLFARFGDVGPEVSSSPRSDVKTTRTTELLVA